MTTESVVTMEMLLTRREALVRVGDIGGPSQFRGFRHPVSVWTLREIDAAIEAIAYRNQSVTPIWKNRSVARSSDTLPPPKGYVWCPVCLGCLERSQTCLTCDGNRVVRHT